MNGERRTGSPNRRRRERRKGDDDRRADGALGGRRTRFTLLYFVLALVLLLGVNYLIGEQQTEQILYSELKERIAAGEVAQVVIGEQTLRATPTDTLRALGAPDEWRAIRVTEDPDLVPLIEDRGIPYEGTRETRWAPMLIWLLPLGLIILFWIWMFRRMNPGAQQGVMTVGKNRARILGEEGTGVTFDDVAGADEAKEELQEVIEFLRTPHKFARLGAKIPKGVLLVGPPGTGKTLLARAVAGEARVTFFSISGSEFVEMFVGVGAARVRDLFEQAKTNAPCIVFIDELDALGKARGVGGPTQGHDEREQTLNQLLAEMDGFDPRTGVIIMAATNRPEILDSALLRPGRFDRQVLVDRPDVRGREMVLKVHAQEIKLAPDVDLAEVAKRTPGFVGADLANLLNEAALLAARRDRGAVGAAEIEEAADRVVAGLEKKNRVITDRERRIVAYHEGGHAIVAERVEHADPVHKISIIPRGVAALGYTQQLPTDDRYLLQRRELLDRLTVLLGGRAAEELVFEEISTGAANDLERASEIARRMVSEFGMSEVVGPASFSRQRSPFLESAEAASYPYSEATARAMDRELGRLLREAHDRAVDILGREREALDQLARRLLDKEVVDRDELREILGEPPLAPGDPERPEVGHVPPSSTGEAAD